jgi:hypothetical protein
VSELATRQPGSLAVPEGARALGARVKPIIRLGMGVKVEGERRDGSKYTRPEKTDHFTVRGDERAIAKFVKAYGEAPKAVKIMVPTELALALDISYRSFVGGGDEDGGRPLALGKTNFATLGYVGGPDVLRVWRQDGSYEEVETLGLDELGKPLDDLAGSLNIAVYATFTFTIPEVLGWGSFAQVTSKGKKSADNLAFKLGQIYGAFGAKAPWAFDRDEPPMLVLKPDTALMRFEDEKGAKWGKARIFVLDIVIPESFDDMLDRLALRQREISGAGGPANMLYGSGREPVAAIEAGSEADGPASPEPEGRQDPAPEAAPVPARSKEEEAEAPGRAEASDSEPQFATPEGAAADPVVQAANEAAEVEIPSGANKGRKIRELLDEKNGLSWLRWALRNWNPTDAFGKACWAFARIYAPDLYEQVSDEKAQAAAS